LLYYVSELPAGAFQRLVELFRMYRAVGALYFWSKRLNIEEGVELALERARQQLPYYYRHAFDEDSQVYQFGEVEKMRRPRRHVLQLPLADALHYHCGAYIEESTLVVRLGNGERLELPLPERALKWLQEKEREVAPLKVTKIVRIQWREDKRPEYLKVQIVLRVERKKTRDAGSRKRAASVRGRELGLRDRVRLRGLRRHNNEGFGDSEAEAAEQGRAVDGGR